MKNLEFPIIATKVKGLRKKFDLNDPKQRREYFQAKVGDEISHIQKFLKNNTFVAFLIGKKNSGKGTYTKLLSEIFGEEKFAHISVGDLVREVDNWEAFEKTKTYQKMKSYYRGFLSFEEAVKRHLSRNTQKLLPTEFILALLKAKIDELPKKSIFIDGMPRESDQISYSLYFRDLINYRDDPDFFVLIDIPESVIDERIKGRVVCPICHTPRNTRLLITNKIEYQNGEFFLLCDNPSCKEARMVKKEGDELGIGPIKERLLKDEEVIKTLFRLYGIQKILLRNHVPVDVADKYFDDYELTPFYSFEWDKKAKRVRVIQKSWKIKDDNGVECFSLLAPPVVVGFIKQMVEVLNL